MLKNTLNCFSFTQSEILKTFKISTRVFYILLQNILSCKQNIKKKGFGRW